MNNDLYQQELKLEDEARQTGINRFYEDTTRRVELGQESTTHYGGALMRRAIDPLRVAIVEFLDAAKKGKAGRRHAAVGYLEMVAPDVAAYLTAKSVIDTFTRPKNMSRVATQVGLMIEDEVRYGDFKAKAPGLWNKLTQQTAGSADHHKRAVLMHTYQKHVAEWTSWGPTQHLHLGMKLVEMFVEHTGFAELKMHREKAKTYQRLHPTTALVEWMERSLGNAAALSPMYLPMVIKPAPWTSPYSGGYISPTLRPLTIIKTNNRAYLEELANIPNQLNNVYDAVNTVQETAWRVNTPVLDTINTLWQQGAYVAGLPQRDAAVIAPYPFPDTHKDDLTDEDKVVITNWKREASLLHSFNSKIISKRLRLARVLGIANRFKSYEEIYFPHTMDFRGRVYAVPLFLNPQGDDIAKGLLSFAEGKRIGDGSGPGWLAIQGANVWGYDKADLGGRIDWVEERSDQIAAVAADPLGNLWWTEADKPWSFLAFCFEWAGFLKDGPDHITHLPIAMDGSCSGLQHFSAALRDPVGGKAVNLVPGLTPSDVYQEVADVVIAKLRLETSTCGSELAVLAGRIIDFGIDRKCTKRATMTLPYGSTRFSCLTFTQEWLAEATEKLEATGMGNPLAGYEVEAAQYLSGLVWDSIGEVVIAARSAMEWLRDTAKVLSKEAIPLHWTTPDGLPIMQEYKSTAARTVKTRFGGKLVYLVLREELDGLDNRRQANGVAPNWVHSMDGTHLRMAVLYGKDNGINSYAVIHDSFGTHACDSDLLAACLRESMVDLYEEDVLLSFSSEVCQFLPTSENIPPRPAFGTLDLNLIKESDYVFA